MSITKICNLLLVLFLSISFYSCADSKPEAKAPTKKQQQRKASNKNSNYWKELKKATGITNNQQKSIVRIAAKYDKQRKSVQKVNGKVNQKRISQLNQAQAKEMKKLLGQELFTKKKAYDKQWVAKTKRK